MTRSKIVDEPLAGRVGEFINVWMRSDQQHYVASEADARALLRSLDLALHPWWKPGVVPAQPGEYWVEPPPIATEAE